LKKLYVVGLGPGGMDDLTIRAREALGASEVIIGYRTYLGLVKSLFPDKTYASTSMGQELERVRMALESAAAGKTTSLICSGDAGIYGMAGPALFETRNYPDVTLTVIPGVTAAGGAAALLGAPLMNDFCVISLSDDLTPWQMIENRLKAAAAGDFVIALYNPKSAHRPENLRKAVDLLLAAGVDKDTPCGLAGRVGREGEWKRLTTLRQLPVEEGVDMFTTVVIGNSETKVSGGYLITKRGYSDENKGAEQA
jgi:precorrin-3B C17-methyltransferase